MVFFILKQTFSTNPLCWHKIGDLWRTQEPVIGLILFLIYVNDLPFSLTSSCADIFDDDTTIGTSGQYIDTLVETVTTELQNILSSCNSNNMSLNVSKTKLMYISSRPKQQILANCDHDRSICYSKIQVSSVEKNLFVSQLVILSHGMLILSVFI